MANTNKPIIDANALEARAKQRPDDMFLKGSGVLKLIQAIRDLERANRQLQAQLQDGEPFAWHVCSVNSDGSLSLEHAAAWEEAAHQHINDAITEHGILDAASWVVRPAYHSPQPDPMARAATNLPTSERLRKQFESIASDRSYKFKRSRRGAYVNPALSRDWKWFQLGAASADGASK